MTLIIMINTDFFILDFFISDRTLMTLIIMINTDSFS